MTVAVVRGAEVPWVRGLDTVAGLPEGYAGNLGPDESLQDTYSRWEQQTLLDDPATTRRIDLVRLLPGFEDPGPAYHDSVEECLVFEGGCEIDGEGPVAAGDYFWRPPGWVHAARSAEGFLGLLMQEGVNEGDGSGRATRRARPAGDLGRNVLFDDIEAALGPRGWVRRQPTSLMPWVAASRMVRSHRWLSELDHASLSIKALSKNWSTGAQSILARFEPGYRDPGRKPFGRSLIGYILSGSLSVDDSVLGRGDLLSVPAVDQALYLSSTAGAVTFLKVGPEPEYAGASGGGS